MSESIDAKVINRVMKDPEFRRRLVANPQATLEKEYKLILPAGVTLKVHEESDTLRHIVVPKAMPSGVNLSGHQPPQIDFSCWQQEYSPSRERSRGREGVSAVSGRAGKCLRVAGRHSLRYPLQHCEARCTAARMTIYLQRPAP
jgi:hypothetical protein